MTDPTPNPPLWEVMEAAFLADVGELSYGCGDAYRVTGDPDGSTWSAILRAIADEVVPEEPDLYPPWVQWSADWIRWDERQRIRRELLKAADEVEVGK